MKNKLLVGLFIATTASNLAQAVARDLSMGVQDYLSTFKNSQSVIAQSRTAVRQLTASLDVLKDALQMQQPFSPKQQSELMAAVQKVSGLTQTFIDRGWSVNPQRTQEIAVELAASLAQQLSDPFMNLVKKLESAVPAQVQQRITEHLQTLLMTLALAAVTQAAIEALPAVVQIDSRELEAELGSALAEIGAALAQDKDVVNAVAAQAARDEMVALINAYQAWLQQFTQALNA